MAAIFAGSPGFVAKLAAFSGLFGLFRRFRHARGEGSRLVLRGSLAFHGALVVKGRGGVNASFRFVQIFGLRYETM